MSALYLGWLGRLIARYIEGLDGAIVFKISLSLFIASVGWERWQARQCGDGNLV